MKYEDEWIRLIAWSKEQGLTKEQIYFLLALREVEDGLEGSEFNIKTVAGQGLKEQALWAIGSIKKNDRRWQDYVRDKTFVEFPKFFACMGGPYGRGWHNGAMHEWTVKLIENIEAIKKEFDDAKS